MKRKGQGSGVFQLLISAVVAIAILGVLLGILNLISPPGQKVSVIARDKLSQAKTSQGTVIPSEKIKVVADDVISYTVGGPELGIERENVCVTVGADLSNLFSHNKGVLRFKGNSARDVKVMAFCLDDTYSKVREAFGIQVDGLTSSSPSKECVKTPPSNEPDVYCIIGIISG